MQDFPSSARVARLLRLVLPTTALLLAFAQSQASAQRIHQSHSKHWRGLSKRGDVDRDGLRNWVEVKRTRTNPRKADTDGDHLKDGAEVKRFHTNPRRADSDGDGLSDWVEIKRTRTDPRRPDNPGATQPQPGQGSPTGQPDLGPSSRPSTPTPPGEGEPPETSPPETEPPATPPAAPPKAVWSPPATAQVGVPVALDGSASTGSSLSCTWSFESSGNHVYQQRSGCAIEFTFEETGVKHVRLTVEDGGGGSDSSKQSFSVDSGPTPEPEPPTEEPETPEEEVETEEPEEDPGEIPSPGEGCPAGATNATSASQLRSAVQGGKDVCVTAAVGNVNLGDLGSRAVTVSTDGGSIGEIDLGGTTDLTIESARFRSIEMRGSHRTHLIANTIGGTQANRVYDQLIFMPETNNDVVIEGNDIGWTKADNSGNTGYGCRCYGTLNRLRFVGNRLHDIAADGFQGVGGSDVLIDRNEIGPVGRNPESSEHSDNIQITGNGSNLRITNNWIHHQGYYEGSPVANSGSTYIHGGSTGSLIYENNLIEVAQGRTEICGLGTGGTSRSNITIRRNTWVDGGRAFSGFPGFEWDCDSGSGNLVERNIAIDPDGGFAQNGSSGAATFSSNLFGQPSLVTLAANGNCTSTNCNPSGQEPIGYRKPAGVSW